jgi:hypothetical protein
MRRSSTAGSLTCALYTAMYIDLNNTKLPKLKKYYLNTFSGNLWTTKNMFEDSVLLVFTLRHEVIYP